MRRTTLASALMVGLLTWAPAAIAQTEPVSPAETTACTPAPGPAPPGGGLCPEAPATIAGRTGCQEAPFHVVVRGHFIDSVSFALDDEPAQVVPDPNSATRYKFLVEMPRLLPGTHRVVATVTFTPESATPPLLLSVTFERCVRYAPAPGAGPNAHASVCEGLLARVTDAKGNVRAAKRLKPRKRTKRAMAKYNRRLAKYQKRLTSARGAYNSKRPKCPGRA